MTEDQERKDYDKVIPLFKRNIINQRRREKRREKRLLATLEAYKQSVHALYEDWCEANKSRDAVFVLKKLPVDVEISAHKTNQFFEVYKTLCDKTPGIIALMNDRIGKDEYWVLVFESETTFSLALMRSS